MNKKTELSTSDFRILVFDGTDEILEYIEEILFILGFDDITHTWDNSATTNLIVDVTSREDLGIDKFLLEKELLGRGFDFDVLDFS
tara:strand:+ start:557 stop:814 length:258 start_codon:yes stop_codon:yes gene_type:complete